MEKKVVLALKIPGVEHHGWAFGGLIPVLLLSLPPSCPRVLGFDHKGSSVPFANYPAQQRQGTTPWGF